jgi:hypothetical protein
VKRSLRLPPHMRGRKRVCMPYGIQIIIQQQQYLLREDIIGCCKEIMCLPEYPTNLVGNLVLCKFLFVKIALNKSKHV